MNSAFAHEQADAIATRVLGACDDTAGRVSWAYATIFGRQPSGAELARAVAHLATVQGDLGESEQRARSGYLRGMISSNEFMFVD